MQNLRSWTNCPTNASHDRWFLVDYIGEGGWNNKDVALVKSDGSEVHDLTQSGYSDGNAKWVLGAYLVDVT